jgi:hypothetical protein
MLFDNSATPAVQAMNARRSGRRTTTVAKLPRSMRKVFYVAWAAFSPHLHFGVLGCVATKWWGHESDY